MMLEHFIASGLKTKRCIISIDKHIQTDDEFSMNEFYFLPFIDKDYVYNSFKSREHGYFKVRTYSRYFPILGLAYYNQQLFFSSLISTVKPHYRHHFDKKGNSGYPVAVAPFVQNPKTCDTIVYLNASFRNIEKICKEHGIQLIWYLPPHWDNSLIDNDLCEGRIIINNRRLFENVETKYMHDAVHVNVIGREIATIALCDSLRKITSY
jgi:hypothetical protein